MSWTENRNQLVEALKSTQLELRPPKRLEHEMDQLIHFSDRLDALLEEFAENVPLVPVSRCPICNQSLELAIDLEGLDSPWWWDDCPEDFAEPRACKHFQLFQGALDLQGRAPEEANVWSVAPGPGAPFVIERLLSMEGMQAVVSELLIGGMYTGYLIAYFSTQAVPQDELHQEWRRETWDMYDEDGYFVGDDTSNDLWDFDLGPWLDSEKLSWIQPGDGNLTVVNGRPSPFEGLPGTQQGQHIDEGEVTLVAAPDGSESEFFTFYEEEEGD